MLLVDCGTLGADECAKGHVAVGAPVLLAIDTEGVELFLINAPSQIARRSGALRIASDALLRERWVRIGRRRDRSRLLLLHLLVLGGGSLSFDGRVVRNFHDPLLNSMFFIL